MRLAKLSKSLCKNTEKIIIYKHKRSSSEAVGKPTDYGDDGEHSGIWPCATVRSGPNFHVGEECREKVVWRFNWTTTTTSISRMMDMPAMGIGEMWKSETGSYIYSRRVFVVSTRAAVFTFYESFFLRPWKFYSRCGRDPKAIYVRK